MACKLIEALSHFSENLVPDPELERRGKAACNRVFEILRRTPSSYYTVAEVQISGSMGRRTAISYPGIQESDYFDVVLFLKVPYITNIMAAGEPLPFKRVLGELERIFKLHPDQITILNTSAPTFIGVQVDGIKLDVAPAVYFKHEHPSVSFKVGHQARTSPVQIQKQKTIKLILHTGRPYEFHHYYSAGLIESAIDYVKTEAARLNAHPLIRLAKFWNASLKIPPHSNSNALDASYLMERMALLAAQECGQNSDLIFRLEKFLQLMSTNFGNIKIIQPWGPVDELKIPRRILPPIVLDPANPYNNLAQLHPDPERRKEIISIYSAGAAKCLRKLKIVKEAEAGGQFLSSVSEISRILDQSDFGLDSCGSSVEEPARARGNYSSASANSSRNPNPNINPIQSKLEQEVERFLSGRIIKIAGADPLHMRLDRGQERNRPY